MEILHIAYLDIYRPNGIRFAIEGLLSNQNRIDNINAKLLNIHKINFPDEYLENIGFEIINYKKNEILDVLKKIDLVVFHSMYMIEYVQIYYIIKKMKIPYIIVPHGCFTEGAQNQKKVKKIIANKTVFKGIIKNAKKIHYLTEREKNESYRRFKNSYFVVGNGVDIIRESYNKLNRLNKKNIDITFIGRIDIHHKGLDLLIESLSLIKKELTINKVKVNLYGSDYRNNKQKLLKLINDKELGSIVNIYNPIYGDDKENILYNSDIFVLTSRFEGHPMALLEAMSCYLPIIATEGTNMKDILLKYNAGWCVSYCENDIAETILKAIKNKNVIIEKGINARKLVEENYTWSNISNRTIDEYTQILQIL